MGGYCFCDHGIDFGDEGGVLVEGVFDLWIPFASFEFVKVYGECDNFMICVYRGWGGVVVLETWWYRLAETRAKSILEAEILLSQENCMAFGC